MGLSVGLCAQYELAAAVTDGCVLVTVSVAGPPSLTLSLVSLSLSLFLPKPCRAKGRSTPVGHLVLHQICHQLLLKSLFRCYLYFELPRTKIQMQPFCFGIWYVGEVFSSRIVPGFSGRRCLLCHVGVGWCLLMPVLQLE